jgi:hypothetical protein
MGAGRGAVSFILLLVVMLAAGCSKLPSVSFDSPFGQSNWVELQDSEVVAGFSPALQVTIVNLKDDVLSVRFIIDQIEGRDDCQNSFRLNPRQSIRYSCAQLYVAEGKQFRAEVQVYRDWGQTKLAERIRRNIEIEKAAGGKLVLVGRPVD